MFWSYKFKTSRISELLESQPIPPLEDFLNEEDIIQEVKIRNHHLISYMSNISIIEQLLRYMITTPENIIGDYEAFKLPTIAIEILTSGIEEFNETFKNNKYLFELCFTYLKDPNVNIITCNYIFRFLIYYSTIAYTDFFNFLVNSQGLFIDVFLQHIKFPIVGEFFVKMITNDITSGKFHFTQFYMQNNFMVKIISMISSNSPPEVMFSLDIMFCEIVRFHRIRNQIENAQQYLVICQLFESVQTDEILSLLLGNMFPADFQINSEVVFYGLKILLSLYDLQRVGDLNGDLIGALGMADEILKSHIVTDFEVIANFIPAMINYLIENSLFTSFDNKKLGICSLFIVRLITSLLCYQSPFIVSAVIKMEALKVFWQLCMKYPFNNHLHTQVCDLTIYIIASCICNNDPSFEIIVNQKFETEDFGDYVTFSDARFTNRMSFDLYNDLFINVNLVTILIEQISNKVRESTGFLGHLIELMAKITMIPNEILFHEDVLNYLQKLKFLKDDDGKYVLYTDSDSQEHLIDCLDVWEYFFETEVTDYVNSNFVDKIVGFDCQISNFESVSHNNENEDFEFNEENIEKRFNREYDVKNVEKGISYMNSIKDSLLFEQFIPGVHDDFINSSDDEQYLVNDTVKVKPDRNDYLFDNNDLSDKIQVDDTERNKDLIVKCKNYEEYDKDPYEFNAKLGNSNHEFINNVLTSDLDVYENRYAMIPVESLENISPVIEAKVESSESAEFKNTVSSPIISKESSILQDINNLTIQDTDYQEKVDNHEDN